jgi:hypothetical protein
MKELLEEMEFYPHAKTVDILDCLGYLAMVAPAKIVYTPVAAENPFSIEAIERELHNKGYNNIRLPFNVQLGGFGKCQSAKLIKLDRKRFQQIYLILC